MATALDQHLTIHQGVHPRLRYTSNSCATSSVRSAATGRLARRLRKANAFPKSARNPSPCRIVPQSECDSALDYTPLLAQLGMLSVAACNHHLTPTCHLHHRHHPGLAFVPFCTSSAGGLVCNVFRLMRVTMEAGVSSAISVSRSVVVVDGGGLARMWICVSRTTSLDLDAGCTSFDQRNLFFSADPPKGPKKDPLNGPRRSCWRCDQTIRPAFATRMQLSRVEVCAW